MITVITSPTTIEPRINIIRICPVQWMGMQWSSVCLKAVVAHIEIAFRTTMRESERDQATSYIHQFQCDVKISCKRGSTVMLTKSKSFLVQVVYCPHDKKYHCVTKSKKFIVYKIILIFLQIFARTTLLKARLSPDSHQLNMLS